MTRYNRADSMEISRKRNIKRSNVDQISVGFPEYIKFFIFNFTTKNISLKSGQEVKNIYITNRLHLKDIKIKTICFSFCHIEAISIQFIHL